MMSGGKEPEFKIPKFFIRPDALAPAPLPAKAPEESTATINGLDVCEGDGLPEIDDEYLSMVHRVAVLSREAMADEEDGLGLMADTHELFQKRFNSDPAWDEDWDHAVAFFAPKESLPKYAHPPKTDEELRSLMAAKNAFRVMTESGFVELKLCRSEDQDHIWVYGDNSILDNACTQTGTIPVTEFPKKEEMSYEERLRNLYLAKQHGLQFCWKGEQLHLIADANVEEHVKAFSDVLINSALDAVPEVQARADRITSAFGAAIKPVQESNTRIQRADERGDEQLKTAAEGARDTKWLIAISTLISVGAMLFISGKIKNPFSSYLAKIDNLSEQARDGLLGKPEHYMFFNDLLKKMAGIFNAPQINTPRILGPNGIGKSALSEAWAVCKEAGHFPDGTPFPERWLKGGDVYSLTPKNHIMGDDASSFLGNAERYLKNLAGEAEKKGAFVFIDEVHTLHNLAATGREGQKSAGAEEGLKPMLARKYIARKRNRVFKALARLVGNNDQTRRSRVAMMSTDEEYNSSIRNNKALHGRTILVAMAEPTSQETVAIMIGKRDRYEADVGRPVTDGAIRAAVKISEEDTSTHYPRKAETALELAYDQVKGLDSSIPLSEDHVYNAAKGGVEMAVQKAVRDSVRTRDLAEMTLPKEQADQVRMESIQRAIVERVEGFDGTLDAVKKEKLGRIIDIVINSWEKAVHDDAKTKFIHPLPEGTPKTHRLYAIPNSFTDSVLKQIAKSEGLTLRDDMTVATLRESAARKGGAQGPGAPKGTPPPPPAAGSSTPPEGGAGASGAPSEPRAGAAPALGDSANVSTLDDLVQTLDASQKKLPLTARNLLDATLASSEKILVGDPNNKAMAMGVTNDAFIASLQLGFDHDIPTRMQNANAILGATKDALDKDGNRSGGIINEVDVIRVAAERAGTSESHVRAIVELVNAMEDLKLIPQKDIINVLGNKSEGEIRALIGKLKTQFAGAGSTVPTTSKAGSGKSGAPPPTGPDGGPTPPAAGSGEPPAAGGRARRKRGEGAKVSHELGKAAKNGGAKKLGRGKFGGSAANRVAVRGDSLERAVGPAMVGTMVGSTVAEHFGVISAEQKQGIDLGMLGGMTAAHPALLWELPVAGPLMALGHEAAQAGLEEVGVGRETLTSKLAGLGGAFATAEAAAYAAGRMAGETGSRALAAGHQIFQNAVRQELPRRLHELKSAVTTGVSTGIQNIRAGAQLYGSQIAASGTAAWAAAKSGAASAAARIAASPATAVAARLVVQANAIFGLFMMPEQVDAARVDKTPGNL